MQKGEADKFLNSQENFIGKKYYMIRKSSLPLVNMAELQGHENAFKKPWKGTRE